MTLPHPRGRHCNRRPLYNANGYIVEFLCAIFSHFQKAAMCKTVKNSERFDQTAMIGKDHNFVTFSSVTRHLCNPPRPLIYPTGTVRSFLPSFHFLPFLPSKWRQTTAMNPRPRDVDVELLILFVVCELRHRRLLTLEILIN